MRTASKLTAIFVFGLIAFLAAVPLALTFVPSGSRGPVYVAVLALVALACSYAPNGLRAWGRGSLVAGGLLLAFPLAVKSLSGDAAQEIATQVSASHDLASTLVVALIGGLLVGSSVYPVVIMGAVLVAIGLLLGVGGRRKQT